MKNSFKQTLIAFLICMCGLSVSAEIKVQLTASGLWCNLICLRKAATDHGYTLPYSAYEEAKAFGFINGDSSLMGFKGEYLTYNPENNQIEFHRLSGAIVTLSVSENKIVSGDIEKKYFIPIAFTGCECNIKTSNSETGARVSKPDYSNPQTSGPGFSNERTITSGPINTGNGCYPYYENDCVYAYLSREGDSLMEGVLSTELKMNSLNIDSTNIIYKWWREVLYPIEQSFIGSNSQKYGELARGLLCDNDLNHFRINYVNQTYTIQNKAMWWDEEIWVTDSLVQYVKYCNVTGLCDNKKGTGDAVMAVFIRPPK